MMSAPTTTPAEAFGRAFAEDALLAYWDGKGAETAPRTFGTDVGAAFGPGAEILVAMDDGANWLVEGRNTDGSFAASVQLDAAGAITRALVYRTLPIDPSPTWAAAAADAPGDASAVLDEYFEHLDAARFAQAADCFSADCLYSHPPYGPGEPRVEFRGREELLAGLLKRGSRPWSHELVVVRQHGADCLLEGTAGGTALGGSFISSLSLDEDGRIRRYAAFYCEPPVPRR
jgi:hypothetical protein